MKTPEQIVERITAVEVDDWMGTIRGDLIDRLPYAMAKPFLKDNDLSPTEEEWRLEIEKLKPPLEAAREYLDFAWMKANDCRGLSAGRSLDHLSAWLWLEGYSGVVDENWANYRHYGKQQLVIASLLCDFDWQKHDNGHWVNSESSPSLSVDEIARLVAKAESIALNAKRDA